MSKKNYCHGCGARLIEKFIEEENKTRLYCASCGKTIYENPVPSTAAVVFNENGDVLLVKRKVEPKIGEWCLPGGYLELHETPENGCLRELKEETGLEGEIDRWAGNILSKSVLYDSVIVMGYTIKNVKGRLEAKDDCLDARYFKRDQMPPLAFKSHQTIYENSIAKKEE